MQLGGDVRVEELVWQNVLLSHAVGLVLLLVLLVMLVDFLEKIVLLLRVRRDLQVFLLFDLGI